MSQICSVLELCSTEIPRVPLSSARPVPSRPVPSSTAALNITFFSIVLIDVMCALRCASHLLVQFEFQDVFVTNLFCEVFSFLNTTTLFSRILHYCLKHTSVTKCVLLFVQYVSVCFARAQFYRLYICICVICGNTIHTIMTPNLIVPE